MTTRWPTVRLHALLLGYVLALGCQSSAADPDPAQAPDAPVGDAPLGQAASAATPRRIGVPAGATTVGENKLLGGNAWMTNAFVDLTRTAGVFSTSYGPSPATDAVGNVLDDFVLGSYDTLGAGTYRATFSGAPATSITVGVCGAFSTLTDVTSDAAGNTTANLAIRACDDGALPRALTIIFRHTGGTLKNLRVVRPGYDLASPPIFTNEFLALFRYLSPVALRTMDAAYTNGQNDNTNGNVTVEWAERARPNLAFPVAHTLSKSVSVATGSPPAVSTVSMTAPTGVPWEYLIAMANELHTDLWVNVPVMASDDYVRQLATLLKSGSTIDGVTYAGLDPTLHVYVEYSNELWNYFFPQARMNLAAAKLEADSGPSNLNYDHETNYWTLSNRLKARRTVQLAHDFADVFGAGALNQRVRVLLPHQAGSGGAGSELDDMLVYVAKNYGAPNQFLYGVAEGGYMGLTTEQDDNPSLTAEQIIADLQADMGSYVPSFRRYVTEAHAWGLEPIVYEGGPALGSVFGTSASNHLEANAAAQKDPRYAALVGQMLDAWYASGGGLFMYYSLGQALFGGYGSQYGDWGITDDIFDLGQPKELAYRAARFRAPAPLQGYFQGLPGEIDARDSIDAYNGVAGGQSPFVSQGYVEMFGSATVAMDYDIESPAAASYVLRLNVPLGQTASAVDVTVNGTSVGHVDTSGAAVTATNAVFGDSAPLALPLAAGANTVRLFLTAGDLNTIKISNPGGARLAATMPTFDLWTGSFGSAVNQAAHYTFSVYDDATADEAVTVTASSDNPRVVPNDAQHLVVERGTYPSGHANRQLTLTPGAESGQANVTLTATNRAGLRRTVIVPVTIGP